MAMHVAPGGTLAHFAPGWQAFYNPPTYLFSEHMSREFFPLQSPKYYYLVNFLSS